MDHTFLRIFPGSIKGERLFGGKPALMLENDASLRDHGASERRWAQAFRGIAAAIPPEMADPDGAAQSSI